MWNHSQKGNKKISEVEGRREVGGRGDGQQSWGKIICNKSSGERREINEVSNHYDVPDTCNVERT